MKEERVNLQGTDPRMIEALEGASSCSCTNSRH